jgi:hypothetical protein
MGPVHALACTIIRIIHIIRIFTFRISIIRIFTFRIIRIFTFCITDCR